MDSGTPDASPLAAELKSDLVYRRPGSQSIAGDLYLPARTTPVPVVLVIHGGGFATGDKAGKAETTWTEHLQTNGFAAFSVNYRVYTDFSSGEVPFPLAIGDIKCAISWLRSNAATYRIDPEKIFALGGSAGGFMTNFLGTSGDIADFTPTDCEGGAKSSNRLQAVVSYFGPSNWNELFNDPARAGSENGEKRFIGLAGNTPCAPNSADAKGICTTASATTYIGANTPPFFLAHSDDDPVVPVGQSRFMKSALEAKGVNVTYQEITGFKHGWHSNFRDPVTTKVRDDVVAWLKERAK